MITPSLESTSCSSAGDFEPVSSSVLSRGAAPLLPLVSAFSGKSSHVVAVLTGWSLTCHLLISLNTRCLLQCIPWPSLVLGYEDKYLLPVSLSPVLRLFLAYCHPNLCTQPFLCPSFGQMFLNVMLNYSTASAPPVTRSWIVAQATKHTRNSLLASWTDRSTPLKSVLDSTKF